MSTKTFADRLHTAAGDDRAFVACAGIDPSPEAVSLLLHSPTGSAERRVTMAAAMERFGGMVVEAVRDHVVAVKPQIAWFETAGPDGLRALERVVEHARRAGLLVVLDAKRGDIAHSAAAYADAWLGLDGSAGIPCDAMTVNASVGVESVRAMAEIAASRRCGLYALVHTSNLDAAALQGVQLADGTPWWHLLARELAQLDAEVGHGTTGGVVGALHPQVFEQARELMPDAPLLVPGVGAQGGTVDALRPLASDTSPPVLVPTSRSLLPSEPKATAAFRHAVGTAAAQLDAQLAALGRAVRIG